MNNVTNNMTFISDNFAFQISDSSVNSQKQAIITALQNNLSILNFSECQAVLKKYYTININVSLIYKKIDFNSVNVNSSNSLSYSIFDSITLRKLDLSPCNNITISQPVKDKSLNLNLIKKFQDEGINVFDDNDQFFTEICTDYSSLDEKIGIKTGISLQSRADTYFQKSKLECLSKNNSCNYSNIDENNYISCQCKADDDSYQIKNFMNDFVNALPNSNAILIKCFFRLFDSNITKNIGFIMSSSISVVFSALLVFFYFLNKSYLSDNFEEIYRIDGLSIKEEISSEDIKIKQCPEEVGAGKFFHDHILPPKMPQSKNKINV